MTLKKIILAGVSFLTLFLSVAQEHPKREFRGAWLSTIWQSRYRTQTTEENKAFIRRSLDYLQQNGFNAVIFQVRPQSDAFYDSPYEAWSRHLTGTAGEAPDPYWDPLAYVVSLCHERNMELHAWINPYRVTATETEQPCQDHLYHQHPEYFLWYGGKCYFDPGRPESSDHIAKIVRDIVSRYDIDAIHMDDYFYPYPVKGECFPDTASYRMYGGDMPIDEWRRDNVNRLVERLQTEIKSLKPWVRFGISPFGIYRNFATWIDGSNSNGLQNYDDLYADVLWWAEKGWVDYVMPQLYWTLQNPPAPSEHLARWWNRHTFGRHLYIGQDVVRTMDAPDLAKGSNQLARKIELSRYLDAVGGNCMWHGYAVLENYKGITDELHENYYAYPAFIPAYTYIDDKCPDAVSSLKTVRTNYGLMLSWKSKSTKDEMQKHIYYAVYRFDAGEPVDLSRMDALVTITRNTAYLLPYADGTRKYIYVVTAFDRVHNESEPKQIAVKL